MISNYKMPAKADLKGRSSTISNAFAISVTPYVRPSEEEISDYYNLLGINEGQCAYCLGDGNGKDHLKPLVKDGMPTGYITDIHNLVPCCQRCNSSKGSKSFKEWYMSKENVLRLKNLGLSDKVIEERFKTLSRYEAKIPTPIDYEKIVGKELWDEYKTRRAEMLKMLNDNQEFCDKLSQIIMSKISKAVEITND
ncbi:MAG: HNH endonuclease [Acutalibacteraceae bacterium]